MEVFKLSWLVTEGARRPALVEFESREESAHSLDCSREVPAQKSG
jgi:hypothetical protein